MLYKCIRPDCFKSFSLRKNLLRHLREHDVKSLKCTFCSSRFLRTNALKKHELENHAVKKRKKLIQICITCKKSKELVTGMKNCLECFNDGVFCSSCERCLPKQCFKNTSLCITCNKKPVKKSISDIIDNKLILNENSGDIENIYSLHYNTINDYLKTSLLIHGSIKFSLVINIMFTKVKHNEPIFETPFFRVGPFTIISEEDFNHSLYLKKFIKIDAFNRNGSEWILRKF